MSHDALLSVTDPFNIRSPHTGGGTFGSTPRARSMTYDLWHRKAMGNLGSQTWCCPPLSASISTGRDQTLSSLTLDPKKWAV